MREQEIQHHHVASGAEERFSLLVRGLTVGFEVQGRTHTVLRELNLSIRENGSYGLVGESGCGKSSLALTLVGYLARNARIQSGSVVIGGVEVVGANRNSLTRLRRDHVSMVFQDPARSLNPTMQVGRQIRECFALRGMGKQESIAASLRALEEVQISDPERIMHSCAYELSGGMQQRAMIAMALAKNPDLLILDEPTTALDVTVEMEVLRLIKRLTEARNVALLMISHNFRIVEQLCERVGVLYAGSLVEEGPTAEVFERPGHPYTGSLLACVPGPGIVKAESRLRTISGQLPKLGEHVKGCGFEPRCPVSEVECRSRFPPARRLTRERWVHCLFPERAEALARAVPPPALALAARTTSGQAVPALKTISLRKTFHRGGTPLKAVDGIDLEVRRGETLGIVGETGSGKSTLAKLVLGLQRPDSGSIIELHGRNLAPTVTERTKEDLRSISAVLQNPDTAINPRHTIWYALNRSLAKLGTVPRGQRQAEVSSILSKVRLGKEILDLYPSHLSGGMKQRVSIARALISHPTTLVCDEPTSGLDVSVQAAFLNLLVELQSEFDLTYVFISHDLPIVQYISDRLLVMLHGVGVELGEGPQAFRPPFHPYTELLMESAAQRSIGKASPPLRQVRQDSRLSAAAGCVFHPLCPRKLGSVCETQQPPVQTLPGGKKLLCHIPTAELAQLQGGK